MSLIHLVRHGQASFGKSDYDKLSELGERQASILGAAMAARGVRPHLMVTGSLQRQQVTGSRLWEAAGWESAVDVDPGWNEYDHDGILAAFKPAYRNGAVMRADLARHRHPRRAFQEMFVAASARWASGEHDEDYTEPFDAFRDRVALALGRVASRLEKGQDAVVVTSGGPMSWVAAALLTATGPRNSLTLPAQVTHGAREAWVNLSQVTVNTGVTTLVKGKTLTVLDVNVHDHLRAAQADEAGDTQLVTYR